MVHNYLTSLNQFDSFDQVQRERSPTLLIYERYLVILHHFRYLNDLEKKIPRKEIIEVEQIFKKTLNDLDPKYKVTICGSYRLVK